MILNDYFTCLHVTVYVCSEGSALFHIILTFDSLRLYKSIIQTFGLCIYHQTEIVASVCHVVCNLTGSSEIIRGK